jgi:hypothetical protein
MAERASGRARLPVECSSIITVSRINLLGGQSFQEDAPGRKFLEKHSHLNMTARRELLGKQSQVKAPLRKFPAEGSHVNMAVRRMLPETPGS